MTMERNELKAIAETLIFASDHPLTNDRIAAVVEGIDRTELREALKELSSDYEERGGGLALEQVAGGWQIRTRNEMSPWLRRLFKTGIQRVSRAAMETLAIIAYKQPLTRAELELIRGVDSAGVFRTLADKRLIKIVGRKDAPGRPPVYGTTRDFLEIFDLKDLSSLPTLKEVDLDGAGMLEELGGLPGIPGSGDDQEVTLGALEALEGDNEIEDSATEEEALEALEALEELEAIEDERERLTKETEKKEAEDAAALKRLEEADNAETAEEESEEEGSEEEADEESKVE